MTTLIECASYDAHVVTTLRTCASYDAQSVTTLRIFSSNDAHDGAPLIMKDELCKKQIT